MAVTVYGWKKPTLELALVSGGSLLANTTYYVCGFMKYNPYVYGACASPISDIYTITTTSTEKTISITQKTYRSITAFADAGGGVTTVTSVLHCLISGDQIKIDSGSYAGTWTITKVDKDTFTIPTAYVDNVAVDCYTDSLYYNHPPYGTSGYPGTAYHCMSYFISTINPFADGITWTGGNQWTNAAYQAYNNTNPALITAQPTQRGNYNGELVVNHINTGVYKAVADYGTVAVYIDATHTLAQIAQAVADAGFPYNCYYNATENCFNLVGSLSAVGSASLTITNTNMTIVCGEFFGSTNTQININSSVFNMIPAGIQKYVRFTGSKNVIVMAAASLAIIGNIVGTNNIFQGGEFLSANTTINYTNLPDMSTINAGVYESKIVRASGAGLMQTSYGAQVWKNCETLSIYWTGINSAKNYEPNIYMMENCYMTMNSYNWHFRFYQYPAQAGYSNLVRFLNIDTDDVNNIKRCIHNSLCNLDFRFYRRMEFHIQDKDGNALVNAAVTIIDNADNEYSGNTDSNGYLFLDYMEQKTLFTEAMATTSSWVNTWDTYYNITHISIIADGYAPYNEAIVNNISLDNVITLQRITKMYIGTTEITGVGV